MMHCLNVKQSHRCVCACVYLCMCVCEFAGMMVAETLPVSPPPLPPDPCRNI